MPKLKFELHKELDKYMAAQFLGSKAGGVDFGVGVTDHHPELKYATNKDVELIDRTFEEFYKKNAEALTAKVNQFQEDWDKVEESFLSASIDLFGGSPFPEGDYIGYVSAINCNPRFLETSSFQIFYRNDNPNGTVAHELMHFLFYAYTTRNMDQQTKDLNQNSGLWWSVAEVFNNVILSSERFVNILGGDFENPYSDLEQYLKEAKRLFESAGNIGEFIDDLFELIKEK